MTAAPRTRTGCTSCRVRHLKCDEALPICRRCQRAGRECLRGYNVRFRYATPITSDDRGTVRVGSTPGGRAASGRSGDFHFPVDQIWVVLPRNVSFVQEPVGLITGDYYLDVVGSAAVSVVGSEDSRSESPEDGALLRELGPAESAHRPPSTSRSPAFQTPTERRRSQAERGGIPLKDILSPSIAHGAALEQRATEFVPTTEFVPANASAQSNGGYSWPLDKETGALFQFYISKVAPELELYDPEGHFSVTVPGVASTSPMVLHGILALASLDRHPNHHRTHERLWRLCRERYQPAEKFESLATSLLLEAFARHRRAQPECTASAVNLYSNLFAGGSFGCTFFWTSVASEIHHSIRTPRAFTVHPSLLNKDGLIRHGSRIGRLHQIIRVCALILASTNDSERLSLSAELDNWDRESPHEFRPYDGRDHYIGKVHAHAAQWFQLCRALLSAIAKDRYRMSCHASAIESIRPETGSVRMREMVVAIIERQGLS